MHRPETLALVRRTLFAAIGLSACRSGGVQTTERTSEVPALAVSISRPNASATLAAEPPHRSDTPGFVSDLLGAHRVHGERCNPLPGPACREDDGSEACEGRQGLCATDDDCPATEACHCDEDGAGRCMAASCRSDDDCEAGKNGAHVCAFASISGGCYTREAFVCRTASDTCVADADCEKGDEKGGFHCGRVHHCVRGRPLYVEAVPQVAELRSGDRWDGRRRFDLRALPESDRRALAEKARRAALDEHASIAAFARTIAELMALGAPPDLLFATQKALGEEIRHAQDTFALAAAAASLLAPATAVEPGPFPAAIAPFAADSTLASNLASSVFLGGCLGEAGAALAAQADAEATPLPDLRAFYEELAAEEASHAALAWRTLDWLWDLPEVPATIAKALANLPEDPLRGALLEPLLAAIAGKRSAGAQERGILARYDVAADRAGS
jgi:hypothetical protein